MSEAARIDLVDRAPLTEKQQNVYESIMQYQRAELGISESTIKKYENGERALSITNLFKIIDYFKVDANTILNVAESKKETSIDSRLELMDCSKKA